MSKWDDLAGAASEPTARELRLTPASAIKPRPVWWLWHNRIPIGEMTVTPGYAGTGKSTFHAWVIAEITNGTLPGIHQGTPRNVIICASEDSWSRSIVPRLMAAGADLDRVYQLGVEGDDRVSLPADNERLEEIITAESVALVSLDPVLSLIDDDLDDYRSKELRKALEPLREMADRTGCSILANAHFNKASGLEPLQKISGSSAWGEVCRAAIAFAYDNNAGHYVMSQIKNNLGPLDHNSLGFKLTPVEIPTDEGPSIVTQVEWLGDVVRGVRDVLGTPAITEEESSDQELAAEMILDILAAGPMQWQELWQKVKAAEGISERTSRRGRDRLSKDGLITKTGGGGLPWHWMLTEKGQEALARVGTGQVANMANIPPNGEELGHVVGHAAALGAQELVQLGHTTTTPTREELGHPPPKQGELGHLADTGGVDR